MVKQREKDRKRLSESFGHGEKRDFRDNLVAIFVDNLNPKVDQIRLWGIIKPFGLVRDVFLSSKFSLRKRRFAFIRFRTMEEANWVVKENPCYSARPLSYWCPSLFKKLDRMI
ncbi:hypothetical protein Ddye_016189 [Dipteronia dyeriana]|uniref:RRM domain-containing protein n=1 Tax=Dipteronia dyeriana TaxID=168575 RepID=A0AAD9U733_9ROSI|nr:hypothetical protein Ddye_016189 [Dipteronia dyeriana]